MRRPSRDPLRGADLNAELILREPLGERVASPRPISRCRSAAKAAQSSCSAPADGRSRGSRLHDGQLFVQPSGDEDVVLHNGSRVAGSTWLRGGDVLDVGGGRLKLRCDDGRTGARGRGRRRGQRHCAAGRGGVRRVWSDEAPTRASASTPSCSGDRGASSRTAPGRRARIAIVVWLRAARAAVAAASLFTSVPVRGGNRPRRRSA